MCQVFDWQSIVISISAKAYIKCLTGNQKLSQPEIKHMSLYMAGNQ